MKKIKWIVAMVFAMVMSMNIVSFAGVYGNSNEECYYNQEWRKAFTNYCTQNLNKNGDKEVQIYWLDNENDHSNDKVVGIAYGSHRNYGDPLNSHMAMIIKPNGNYYFTHYEYLDGSYSDLAENPNWRSEERRIKDLNEFSKYAPEN